MGTRRDARPPEAAPQPVDHRALEAALRLFVATFIVDDKRSQLREPHHDRARARAGPWNIIVVQRG